jgi:ribonuclease PH
MNVVVLGQPGEEPRFVEVQGTAEGQAFSRSELDALLGLATGGLGRIIDLQAELVASPPSPRQLGR